MRNPDIYVTGGKWHTRRKILTPTFHFAILQQFTNIFVQQSQILTQELEAASKNKHFIDVVPIIVTYTLNSICGKLKVTSYRCKRNYQLYSYVLSVINLKLGLLLCLRAVLEFVFVKCRVFTGDEKMTNMLQYQQGCRAIWQNSR